MAQATVETNFGNIVFELLPNYAPETVRNFVKLARSGFYDGLLFHRIVPGWVIQGGDPNTRQPDRTKWGMGGPGYTIKAEFNSKSHVRGVVSMARSDDPDSAGSQFFIVTGDSTFLDGQYTAFGEVTSGMEVADVIGHLPRGRNECPTQDAKILRVTISE